MQEKGWDGKQSGKASWRRCHLSLKDDEGEMGEISEGRRAFQAEGGAQIDN